MAGQSEICILITAHPRITNGGSYIIKQGKCQRKGQVLLGREWGDVRDLQLPEYRSYVCQIPVCRTNKMKNTVTGKTAD